MIYNMLMLLAILISPVASAAHSVNQTIVNDDNNATEINVARLLNALDVPECMKGCIYNLTQIAPRVMDMLPSKALDVICKEFKATQKCVSSSPACHPIDTFQIATSGLIQICGPRRGTIKLFQKCIDEKTNGILQGCERKCGVRDVLANLSNSEPITMAEKMGGNVFMVAENASGICGSLQCFLPCLNAEMNMVCPFSGFYLVDSLLIPLDKAASLLEKVKSPIVKDMIVKKLDSKCLPFVQKQSLAELRIGIFKPTV